MQSYGVTWGGRDHVGGVAVVGPRCGGGVAYVSLAQGVATGIKWA